MVDIRNVILVVGGDVTGPFNALFLARQKVCLQVERHPGLHPRVHALKSRTVELYRQVGLRPAARSAAVGNPIQVLASPIAAHVATRNRSTAAPGPTGSRPWPARARSPPHTGPSSRTTPSEPGPRPTASTDRDQLDIARSQNLTAADIRKVDHHEMQSAFCAWCSAAIRAQPGHSGCRGGTGAHHHC